MAVATPCWPAPVFGDHARLAHALGKQRLADGIVDLVRAGVVQILALEINLRAAEMLGPALGVIDGARPADVVLEFVFELGAELRIDAITLVCGLQLIERLDQRFGDEHAAIRAEMSALVGQVIHLHCAPLS